MRGTGAERPVVAEKSGKLDGAKGSRHPVSNARQPRKREDRVEQAKSFCISKRVVWEAYKRVKAKKGASGVDDESIEMFEQDLKNNLYKIWNRMSSGTYFPPPVRAVGIPKKDGGERRLGIPTVSDRVAQALGDWVIDLDVRGLFDNLDHSLILRAVGRYTQCRWILLYVKRWLEAPEQRRTGRWYRERRGHRKVESPVLFWPISSCTRRTLCRRYCGALQDESAGAAGPGQHRASPHALSAGVASAEDVYRLLQG